MPSKSFFYEYSKSYDDLINDIISCYDKKKHYGDDTWYYDFKHQFIDEYVVNYDFEAKEVVNKYGVFKLIEEYENQYGKFEIDKSEYKNYLVLYYVLIDNYIMENHIDKLEQECKNDDENTDEDTDEDTNDDTNDDTNEDTNDDTNDD